MDEQLKPSSSPEAKFENKAEAICVHAHKMPRPSLLVGASSRHIIYRHTIPGVERENKRGATE